MASRGVQRRPDAAGYRLPLSPMRPCGRWHSRAGGGLASAADPASRVGPGDVGSGRGLGWVAGDEVGDGVGVFVLQIEDDGGVGVGGQRDGGVAEGFLDFFHVGAAVAQAGVVEVDVVVAQPARLAEAQRAVRDEQVHRVQDDVVGLRVVQERPGQGGWPHHDRAGPLAGDLPPRHRLRGPDPGLGSLAGGQFDADRRVAVAGYHGTWTTRHSGLPPTQDLWGPAPPAQRYPGPAVCPAQAHGWRPTGPRGSSFKNTTSFSTSYWDPPSTRLCDREAARPERGAAGNTGRINWIRPRGSPLAPRYQPTASPLHRNHSPTSSSTATVWPVVGDS